MKNRNINVKDTQVTITTRHEQDYISLSDMVKNFDGGSALLEQWLKNNDTVLFLGVWEQLNNPSFNSLEFEGIKNNAGRDSFFLSVKKYMEITKTSVQWQTQIKSVMNSSLVRTGICMELQGNFYKKLISYFLQCFMTRQY